MPATIEKQSADLYTLRLTGILKQSEFGEVQTTIEKAIESGAQPRLLALLDNFEGWEKGADWNDLDFLFKHSNEIAKIAIVGAPQWETQALAFAGAGFRRAPVNFFPSDKLEAARKWIAD
jgi:hypothetical protein